MPALAALLVYASTLGAGFLYDDHALIEANNWVHDPGVLWQLPGKPLLDAPAGVGHVNYYRPVVTVLYNLTWQAGGGKPHVFHLLSVLLHMLNATLLLMLVRRVSAGRSLISIGAAVLFAVHPLNTEAVAWPSCLPELGYVAFGMSALLTHVAGRRIASWVLFGLACACKETALVFVPLVVVYELWVRRARVLPIVRTAAPYLAVAAIYFAVRTAILGGLVPAGAHGMRTTWDSILNAPILLLGYLKLMVVPSPLLIQHVVSLVSSVGDPRFWMGAGVILAGTVGVLRLRRSRPDLAFAASVMIVPLLPALYLPALGRDPFAERYAYLGVAGFCWLVVGGAEALASRLPRAAPRWALPALLVAVCLTAAATTAARCGDWYDDGTLGLASIREEPKAAVGYLLRGDWLRREGSREAAWRVYQAGLEQAPSSTELQQLAIGMGVELGRLSREDVMAAYERLVPLSQDSAPALFNLGHALLEGGRLDAADAAFTRALVLAPGSVPSMMALATVASKRGDTATAITLLERVLESDPKNEAAIGMLREARNQTP